MNRTYNQSSIKRDVSTHSNAHNRQRPKKLPGIAFGIFLLVLWQVLAIGIDASYILPTPISVGAHIVEHFPELMKTHFPITMGVVLLGGIISIALGLGFAILMTLSKSFEKAVYPILTISQTIPTMCLAPIFVLWFGYSVRMRVIMVVLMTFFSITVNVFDGFQSVSKDSTELLTTYGAGTLQQFFLLKIPSALPNFFTALKSSLPWAVVAAAVAEWFGSPGGLGNYSRQRMMSLDTAGLIAPLVIISITALVITAVIKLVEKKVVTWN